MAAVAPAPSPVTLVLERGRRFSESSLWDLQRAYFEREGARAWSTGTVPHYITCNPYLAAAYAEVVLAFLADCDELDRSRPVYLVELGAGSGRFAFHFLKRLEPLLAASPLRDLTLTYVLTDLPERTVEGWRTHPWFEPLVACGRVDFARFDAVVDEEIALIGSGVVLAPGMLANPLVAIANYVFDGLPQDCFAAGRGRLSERLVTLETSCPGLPPDAPEQLAHVDVTWEEAPVGPGRLADPSAAAVLEAYRESDTETTILFPTAALRCIRALERLSGGPLLLLTGDKGHASAAELPGEEHAPSIAVHGSVSLMVNYHAIGSYVRLRGGLALHPSHTAAHLTVAAYLLGGAHDGFRDTAAAYTRAIDDGGPDDVYTVKKALELHFDSLPPDQLLAFIRLCGWDAKIFLDVLPTLTACVANAPATLRADLRDAVERVWDSYFPIGESRDLAYGLGRLLYELGDYTGALTYFQHSLGLYELDAHRAYALASCHGVLGDRALASAWLDRALELDPAFAPALDLRDTLATL